MDLMKRKYTPWQLLKHRFQARRDIPFRKKFFVGYDLTGNTYWEFTVDGNMQRLRRKLEPYEPKLFKVDYFSTIPIQWLQWLRRTKQEPPTLEELVNDQLRQERIKILAQQADDKWKTEKLRLEKEHEAKLQIELERSQAESDQIQIKSNGENHTSATEEETQNPFSGPGEKEDSRENPWEASEKSKDENPIVSASIKPRK